MILVDSSVWIDFYNGFETPETDTMESLLEEEMISIADIIYLEVLRGFKSDSQYRIAKRSLDILPCHRILDQKMAVKAAENYRFLRKKGITITKTIDLVIGTFCIEKNISLLTSDRDFLPMEELGLVLV